MICECYRSEKNFLGKVGVCWGTAERDACSRGGDKSKCDFYPSVREEEKKPVTNYDRIVSKSPEEMAEYLAERSVAPSCTGKCHKDYEVYGDLRTFCHDCWLEYLKRVVEE